MKIFGYEIKKVKKDNRLVYYPKIGKISAIGVDLGTFESQDIEERVQGWISALRYHHRNLTPRDIVSILNIFIGEVYPVELYLDSNEQGV